MCIANSVKRFGWVWGSRYSAFAAIVITLFVNSACSQVDSVPSSQSEGDRPADVTPQSLVWERAGDIVSLDPHRTADVFSWQVFDQIYDTLLAFDAEGNLVPHLAREWQISDDGLTVTFVLNERIQCHDGTPFTADDVKYTVDRALDESDPSVTRANWGSITRVEVVNPSAVTFHFSEPFSAFVPFMADPFASMLCDSVAELPDFGEQSAVGAGPWKLARWRRGDELVLEKNSAYVNYGRPVENPGAPHLDKLIIRPVEDASDRLDDLQAGIANLITDPPIDQLDALQSNPELALVTASHTGQSIFFQFNVARPPFNDIRARQAIAHAINPDVALQSVFGNLVQREHCPVGQGVLGHDPDFCDRHDYDYDPERAKALLAELGYSPENPLDVTLLTWVGDRREDLVAVFQQQLAEVGIQVELETMDISSLNARVKLENQTSEGKGTFDLMGWAWYDPDILYALWHSPGAYDGYQSPELDALLKQTRQTTNPAERVKAVQAAQAHLLTQAVVVPVYGPGWLWMYASDATVSGLKIGPFNRPLFNDVTMAPAPDW